MATTHVTDYRPDIDGLRAIAVLAVIAYHYGVPGVPGGFTGVDIFFVISGYLITSIIRDDLEAGTFSFTAFYGRRIRRIVPALLLVIAVTFAAGFLLLWPEDYMWLGWSGAFAAIGGSNFFFARNINYFSQAAELMPLLHTWSLGIEEQFYLLWPVALVALFRWLRRLLVPVLALVAIVSFLAALDVSRVRPAEAFYMLPYRAWELGLGGLVAFAPVWRWWGGALVRIAGFCLVTASILLVRNDLPFPGPFALPAVLGAALLAYPVAAGTLVDRAMGWLAPVGRISYSLYLWHWPVIALYRNYKNALPITPLELTALFGVTVVFSVLTYKFVEQPSRRFRGRKRVVYAAGGAGLALVVLASVITGLTGGWNMRLDPRDRPMQNIQAMWDWPCPEWLPLGERDDGYCRFGASWQAATSRAIVWGDSHAQHLAPMLHALAQTRGTSLILAGECAAVIGPTAEIDSDAGYQANCRNTRAEVLHILADDPTIDVLILSAAWSIVTPRLRDARDATVNSPVEDLLYRGLRDLLVEVGRPGLRVVIVADNPNLPDGVSPTCAIMQTFLLRQLSACHYPQAGVARVDYDSVEVDINAAFDRLSREYPQLRVLPIADSMCSGGTCIVELDGEFLYRDAGHFRRNLPEATNLALGRLLGLDQLFL